MSLCVIVNLLRSITHARQMQRIKLHCQPHLSPTETESQWLSNRIVPWLNLVKVETLNPDEPQFQTKEKISKQHWATPSSIREFSNIYKTSNKYKLKTKQTSAELRAQGNLLLWTLDLYVFVFSSVAAQVKRHPHYANAKAVAAAEAAAEPEAEQDMNFRFELSKRSHHIPHSLRTTCAICFVASSFCSKDSHEFWAAVPKGKTNCFTYVYPKPIIGYKSWELRLHANQFDLNMLWISFQLKWIILYKTH